jgi:acid phosphatase
MKARKVSIGDVAFLIVGAVLLIAPSACSSPTSVRSTISPGATANQPLPSSTSSTQPTSTSIRPSGLIPNFSHIFQIVLENTSYSHILGSSQAPYINSLANQYGLATQFYAITHPSLPNYFALTAGTTFDIDSDCDLTTPSCPQKGTNLADVIEQSGRTWIAYFESMPVACDATRQPPYTIHVNPFIYYPDIANNLQRCQSHLLPYDQTQFFTSLSANSVPNYVWISPNLNNDMHNGSIHQADTWLSTVLSQIMSSQSFQNSGLIILTFDEGDDGNPVDASGCCGYTPGGGHIITLLISPLVTKGYQSRVPETHYSLLRTIEDAWDLPYLGESANAAPMKEFFS